MVDRKHLWPQTLTDLAKAVEHRIAACRRSAHPNEAVGLVFPDGTIASLPNKATDPRHEYHVRLRDISEAVARKGLGPVGIWHTHAEVDAVPSEADEHQLEALARRNTRPTMFIYGVDGLRLWTWEDGLQEIAYGDRPCSKPSANE